MNSNMLLIVFVWLFFLICGGVMMLGTYLIFGRKHENRKPQNVLINKGSKTT